MYILAVNYWIWECEPILKNPRLHCKQDEDWTAISTVLRDEGKKREGLREKESDG